MSFATVSARRVMAFWFMSESLGGGRPMILEALSLVSSFLFGMDG